MTAQVFVHIPKTGGVSVQVALGLAQYRYPRDVKTGMAYDGLLTFGHQPIGRLVRRGLLGDDLFTFAFCRNPFDRTVSLWAHRRRDYEPELTFPDFCRSLSGRPWLVRSLQVQFLEDVTPDFLGRFETLQEDFGRLCDVLGIERRTLPRLNWSDHAPAWTYYDQETLGIVRATYAADFERFGYDNNSVPD